MANNGTTKRLVSTIGYQYFGKGADGSDKSLSVSYLENNISIGIFSMLPASQQTDRSKFDYNSGHTIYLRGKQAKVLSRVIKKACKSMAEGEVFEPRAISSAGNLIEVASAEHYGMSGGLAIAIYNNIKPDKTTDAPATFMFSNEKLIANYDHTSGSYSDDLIDADVDYFIDQLTEFAKGITGAKAHCIKKEFDYNMNKFASRQIEMCRALNINIESPIKARNDWSGGSSYNRSQTQSGYSNQHATSINTDDLMSEIEAI